MNDQVADALSSVPSGIFSVQPSAIVGGIDSASSLGFYKTLADSLQDGIAFLNANGRVRYWNPAMVQLTGIAAGDTVGTSWNSAGLHFVSVNPTESVECPVAACLQTQTAMSQTMKIVGSRPGDLSLRLGPGTRAQLVAKQAGRDVLVNAIPVDTPHDGGAVVIVRDLSDRIEMQSQILSLHKKAMSDPLTGVANRSEFDQCLLRCASEASQQGATFSLIMCDIDHFKRINDVHGHPAGDKALIQFADVLRRHTRSSDLIVRYGGEEFIVLAVNSDKATATRRANEIRRAVAATPLDGISGQSITVSIGVAEYQNGETPASIVARADRALLDAKATGRNRVV